MSFHPGQSVVCVNNDGAPELTLNKIYTIYRYYPIGGGGVMLEEIKPSSWQPGFKARRFRPLNPAKLDWARKLVEPVPA